MGAEEVRRARQIRRALDHKNALEKLNRAMREAALETIKQRPTTMKFERIGAREEWEKF